MQCLTRTVNVAAKLTHQQRLFIAEYMKDLNATRAAIRAGYSKKTAHSSGPRLLDNVGVKTEIDRQLEERVEKAGLEAEDVMEELMRLAFSDLREHVGWGPKHVTLKESAGLTDEAAAAVAEVSKTVGEYGSSYKIKLHDKLGALRDLAKIAGMYPKDGSSGVNVNVNIDNRPKRDLAEMTEAELEFYERMLAPSAESGD